MVGFILIPRVFVLCEMQTASSRIRTRVAVSISYDDNRYTTSASYIYITKSFIGSVLVDRVFERPGFSLWSSHIKDLKMVLDASLLNIQHYKERIKGKAEQSRERIGLVLWYINHCTKERRSALRYTSMYKKRGAFGPPSTTSPTLLLYKHCTYIRSERKFYLTTNRNNFLFSIHCINFKIKSILYS